jgi:nitrate/nitrite-specific signal transduction histidine kinase
LLLPKSISERLLRLRRSAQDLLAAADDDVDQTEDRLFVLVALLPACMVALLGALSMRLRRRILKPARVLEQALDELRRGGWPEELSSSGLQELGGVTQKFNAMAQDKRHVEEALREVQAELQSRVALRTHELELLNASLEGEIQERRGHGGAAAV